MSTHTSLLPARTPRSAFGKLLQSETKVAWRVPLGLVLGVAVPILLLVIFGTIPGLNKPAFLGGLTWFGVYFPILIALVLATLSLLSLPVHLATYREQGILRRMSTTPVPPSWMLAAQVIVNLALAVVAVVILVVAGTAGFGLGAPKAAGGFALALVLTIAAMFAIGLWISAIARTASVASAIGSAAPVPPAVLSGLSSPGAMPSVLRHIGDWTPAGRRRARAAGRDAGHLPVRAVAAGPGRLGGAVRLPGGALLPVGVAASRLSCPAERGGGQDVDNDSRR